MSRTPWAHAPRLLAFCLALLISALSLIKVVGPATTGPDDFFLILGDKERLLETVPGPRLILVGGSNNLFGIDSEELSRGTNLNVVNAGLHAGLGIEFVMDFVSPHLRPGDIVLLCPEYYLGRASLKVLAQAARCYPGVDSFATRTLSGADQVRLFVAEVQEAVGSSFNFAKSKLRPDGPTVYCRKNMNSMGDMVGHFKLDRQLRLNILSFPDEPHYAVFIDKMARFCHSAQSRGSQVVYCFPTLCESEFVRSEAEINRYQIFVQQLGIPLLNDPASFVYPDEMYFDTAYHLGPEGTRLRTRGLIERVNRYLTDTRSDEGVGERVRVSDN